MEEQGPFKSEVLGSNPRGRTMQKWEYKIIIGHISNWPPFEINLHESGLEGWRLVQTVSLRVGEITAFMEREIAPVKYGDL